MTELVLFTDGSVHSESKTGIGGFLLLERPYQFSEDFKDEVRLKQFENTSSTKLEIQTLLWAFSEINISYNKLTVYTDSQNIIGLPGRQKKLEQNGFMTSKNKLHENHLMYKEFFNYLEVKNIEFIKIKGHQPKKHKEQEDLLFTMVDKAVRKASRTLNSIK
jgi:ribonuclease HI